MACAVVPVPCEGPASLRSSFISSSISPGLIARSLLSSSSTTPILTLGCVRRGCTLMMVRAASNTDVTERIVAASGYLLPVFDGVQYGRYFFTQFPASQVAFQPLYPLLRVYNSTPFASVAVFFSLYFLVVRNPRFSRYVRFNTMQAVVLDVLLIIPSLLEGLFQPQSGIGHEISVVFYNTIFLFLVACFLIGSGSCLLGKTPRLPLVADAADAQIM